MYPLEPIKKCLCCGSQRLSFRPVLWKRLIKDWKINKAEVGYIDRQQGLGCDQCRSSLRTMALGMAIMRCHGFCGTFEQFASSPAFGQMRILEINEAGQLTQYFKNVAGHVLAKYPQVDMTQMPYADDTFDLVVHSDTLEHVPDPVKALSECRRVLKPGGLCAYTVPIIMGRMTRSRDWMRASYHGDGSNPDDYKVCTEYGSDAWRHLIEAGFDEFRMFTPEHPAAHAIAAVKTSPLDLSVRLPPPPGKFVIRNAARLAA